METLIEKIPYRNWTIEAHIDNYPSHPREDFDPLGTIIEWHSKYDIGEEKLPRDKYDIEEWLAKREANKDIVLHLYIYDHSGIRVNTTGFACPWDSGQVGFIYVTLENLRKAFGQKRISKKLRDKATKILQAEVRILDQYLTGEVYGYRILNVVNAEVNACWGYYDLEGMIEDARILIDSYKEA